MKVSLKFREERPPLWRIKLPITILGLPFRSAVAAGETRDLRLDLATAFHSGPALRLSYRPNDPSALFTLALKTADAAPLSMSAEFSLLGRAAPAFRLLLKPRLGDFSLKGAAASYPPSDPVNEKPNGISAEAVGGGGRIDALLAGAEVNASSTLPLPGRKAVKFRWGVTIPTELQTAFHWRDLTAGIPLRKLPLLAMSKISVEHVAGDKRPKADDACKDAEHLAACLSVRQQLEALYTENGLLRRAVEGLRSEVSGEKPDADVSQAVLPSNAAPTKGTKAMVATNEQRRDLKPVEVSRKHAKELKNTSGTGK